LSPRIEIAHLLFITDNRNAKDVEQEWINAGTEGAHPYYLMADALIAAGYERRE